MPSGNCIDTSKSAYASNFRSVMGPARAEVWWSDISVEGGGSFVGATIRRTSRRQTERVDERVRVDVVYDGDDCGERECLFGYFYADGSLKKLETSDGENVPVRPPMHAYSPNGSAAQMVSAIGGVHMQFASRQVPNTMDGGVKVFLAVSCAKLMSWLDPEELRNALSIPVRRRVRRGSMLEASAPAGCEALIRQAHIVCIVDATAEVLIQAGSCRASLSFLARTGNHIIGQTPGASGAASALARFYSAEEMLTCFFPSPSDIAANISRGTLFRDTDIAIPGAALYATSGPLPHAVMIATSFQPCKEGEGIENGNSRGLFYVWGALWTDGRISELTGLPASEAQPLTRRLCREVEAMSSTDSGIALSEASSSVTSPGTCNADPSLRRIRLRWLDQKGAKCNLAYVLWKTRKASARFGPEMRGFESVIGALHLRSSYVVVSKGGASSARIAIAKRGPHPGSTL